jgi:toxin YoeB
MEKFRLEIKPKAQNDFKAIFKAGDKATIKKLERIFEELSKNPYLGIGNPEKLKHDFQGYMSRRITSKDRIIYKVDEIEKQVIIVSALGHYGDK